ncbi:MAG: hypothetical protein WDO74_18010 [Pseudomonadota bacterium]
MSTRSIEQRFEAFHSNNPEVLDRLAPRSIKYFPQRAGETMSNRKNEDPELDDQLTALGSSYT